ncbi:copper type II ascorbate-dependent monooxygenase domain protein [Ancylostoma ceylanicum]|uniref:Copper type II ascorbate-dependent monooxygenase domain protein n=1 Tax=Ancylostoma ceylanicum TaxID=53326 RepID=A0A0D6LRM8_9BILA|nr:copper type II ascorbate-dependent monooxygenase domain protein [Ancylostoma ceylanicum]
MRRFNNVSNCKVLQPRNSRLGNGRRGRVITVNGAWFLNDNRKREFAWEEASSLPKPIYFPPEAGLPLGGEDGKNYIKVEIHYNNPGLISGVVDNSGFELVVTTELREYDAGIMEIGLIYSDANSIPPGQTAFPLTGHCVADCTNKLPSGGIHVFGSQLHAHLSGRKIFTSHYRHGVKIGEINRDNHYSPHWQHIVFIRPYIHVMPVSSRADSENAPLLIQLFSGRCALDDGGYGIEDEMCVNYIYYFPASEVEVCKSAVDNTTLHNFFEHEHGILKWELPIHEKYESIDWTDENVLSLKELYTAAPLNMHCYRNDGTLFRNHPSNWTAVPQPRIFTAPYIKYRDENDCPALND